jgi:hypothetical protein
VPKPAVYLCTKGSCGGAPARVRLAEELAGAAEVTEVRCQSVCEGPVAGVEVDGRLEWFERVRTAKARRGLRRLLAAGGAGPLPKPLAKRRRSKRSGKLKR